VIGSATPEMLDLRVIQIAVEQMSIAVFLFEDWSGYDRIAEEDFPREMI
jgi:hypothetical protein